MGCTFYFAVQRAMTENKETVSAFAMLTLSLIGFALWIGEVKGWVGYHNDLRLVVKAFALSGLTAFVFLNPKMGALPPLNLYNPLTKFFGDKSYTIYLAHPIIISWTKPWLVPIYEAVPDVGVAILIYALIVLIITCAAAAVISTFIEEPLYKRGRALASKEMATEKTGAK